MNISIIDNITEALQHKETFHSTPSKEIVESTAQESVRPSSLFLLQTISFFSFSVLFLLARSSIFLIFLLCSSSPQVPRYFPYPNIFLLAAKYFPSPNISPLSSTVLLILHWPNIFLFFLLFGERSSLTKVLRAVSIRYLWGLITFLIAESTYSVW